MRPTYQPLAVHNDFGALALFAPRFQRLKRRLVLEVLHDLRELALFKFKFFARSLDDAFLALARDAQSLAFFRGQVAVVAPAAAVDERQHALPFLDQNRRRRAAATAASTTVLPVLTRRGGGGGR